MRASTAIYEKSRDETQFVAALGILFDSSRAAPVRGVPPPSEAAHGEAEPL